MTQNWPDVPKKARCMAQKRPDAWPKKSRWPKGQMAQRPDGSKARRLNGQKTNRPED